MVLTTTFSGSDLGGNTLITFLIFFPLVLLFMLSQVSLLERSIQDFKERSTAALFTERDLDILSAIKDFLVKIISHEHRSKHAFTIIYFQLHLLPENN